MCELSWQEHIGAFANRRVLFSDKFEVFFGKSWLQVSNAKIKFQRTPTNRHLQVKERRLVPSLLNCNLHMDFIQFEYGDL